MLCIKQFGPPQKVSVQLDWLDIIVCENIPKKFRRKATYAIFKLCLSACDGLIGFFHGNLMVYYGDISIEKTECLNVQ